MYSGDSMLEVEKFRAKLERYRNGDGPQSSDSESANGPAGSEDFEASGAGLERRSHAKDNCRLF
jgi:hypothetical protein